MGSSHCNRDTPQLTGTHNKPTQQAPSAVTRSSLLQYFHPHTGVKYPKWSWETKHTVSREPHHFVFEVFEFISIQCEPPLFPALQQMCSIIFSKCSVFTANMHPQIYGRLKADTSYLHERSLFHQIAFLRAQLKGKHFVLVGKLSF